MSCPEIVSLYNAIRTDTNQRMGDYIAKLQSRYGDPRAYQAQQSEMRREEAAMLHDQGRRRENLLEDAYKSQVEKNRKEHATRLKTLSLAQSRRPESQAPARRSRMQQPAPEPAADSAEVSAAAALSAATLAAGRELEMFRRQKPAYSATEEGTRAAWEPGSPLRGRMLLHSPAAPTSAQDLAPSVEKPPPAEGIMV